MADPTTDPWAGFKPVQAPAADPWANFKPVQAPAAEKVIATTPDGGRIVEMADGKRSFTSPGYATSDPAQIERIMKGATPAEVSRTSGVSDGGGVMNAVRQGLQGATFGFGDEVVAAGAAALGPNSYDTELDRERARVEAGAAERPVQSLAANVGGGVMSALATAPAAASAGASAMATRAGQAAEPIIQAITSRLPAIVPKIAGGAALGAADGALVGFGTGEGGFGERADNAGDSALLGALFGGAIPVAQAALRPVMGGIKNLAAAPFSSQANPANAGRAVEKAMSRAGTTQDEVAAALQQAASEGQPMFTVADAIGDPARGILNGVMRQPGAAKNEATDFLVQRQSGQGDRLTSFLSEALGAQDTAAARVSSIEAARNAAADEAFGRVRGSATPVDVRDVLATIDARVTPMQGVGIDPGPIDKSLMGIRSRLASRTPATDAIQGVTGAVPQGVDATKTAVELSDFDRVFALRREVADEMDAAYRAGRGQLGSELRGVREALDAALENASPDYRDAMSAYRSASDNTRAVEAGQAATSGRVRSDDVLAAIQDLSPEQLSAYRVGYADPTIARVESAAPGVNKARPLTSDKARAELGALAADPALLDRRVGRENEMFRTGGRVMGGSATVENLSDVSDAARSTATLAGQAVINPVWALRRFAGNVTDAAINGVTGNNEATRAEIARAMMSSDIGSALAPLFAARQRAQQADDMAALLGRTYANRAVVGQEDR